MNGGGERDQRLADRDAELILTLALADYDRRRATRWGRFLLWLLRKTT
jgi:hypothetical protein